MSETMSRNIRQTVIQTFHNLLEQNDITLQEETVSG